jgi:hypothetical protein
VLNTENGYEYLPGYATNRRQVYHTATVRRAAWRIVCAGGYFAAGFISTLGHSDAWNRIEPGSRHPFLIQDAGAAAQLAVLYEFFEKLPYWRMNPRPEPPLCLAAECEVYVVYLPHGGSCKLDLPGAGQGFDASWFNPREGKPHGSAKPVGGAVFEAPDAEDWVLLVGRN